MAERTSPDRDCDASLQAAADAALQPAWMRSQAAIYFFLIGLAAPISDIASGRTRSPLLAWLALAAFVTCFGAAIEITRVQRTGNRPIPSRGWYVLARGLVGVMFAIALATLLEFDGNWWVLMLYVATTSVSLAPLRWGTPLLGGLALIVLVTSLAQGGSIPRVVSFAPTIGMVGYVVVLLRRRSALIHELQRAHGEVARLAASDAVTEERLRFARDLHDLLGHSLSVIVLKTELARRLLEAGDAGDRAHAEVRDIEQLARRALEEVREAVTGYRARSLTAELARARAALEAADVAVTTQITAPTLPPAVDDLLAWIVREAATNIVRHSHAQRVELTISADDGVVRLDIRNDGVAARDAGNHSDGSGLAGLRERVTEAGGRLTSQQDGAEFRVTAVVPAELAEIAGAAP